jgi:hypothetical protein
MAITIEYLAIFRRSDTFCDSSSSFLRLLQVDSNIKVTGGDIKYQGERACGIQLSDGEVADKKQRYFHLHFTWYGDPDTTTDELERFTSLLKAVRGAVQQARGVTETLWDDLSAHYSRKAYPLVHEIENLMRRLIANFMLVTVGREWVDETLPKAVEDAVKNSKRKDYLNVLHTVDFIHLGEFLFTAYSKKTPQELYAKLKDVKNEDDAKALADFIPQSNWKRYFGTLVSCEDGYLKARWDKLYDLRCKVAHNALMTKQDLDEIERLIVEVKPKLQEAIGKLSKVKVPSEDAELVAESAARTVNATAGEFITCWQQLESAIASRVSARGKTKRIIHSGQELMRLGILDRSHVERYDEIRQLRNGIVHGPSTELPVEMIRQSLRGLRELLACVEAGYVEYLRVLSESDRETEIDSRIADTCHDILESEAFNSEAAITNAANYSIDEYEVQDIDFEDVECIVKLTFSASGEQLEDRMFCGDRITGECEVAFDSEGRIEYRDIQADVDQGDAGDGPESEEDHSPE